MRRLRRLSRPLNAIFALWFAFVLGDPGVLHACPMHGGHGANHAVAAAHAGHEMHGASMASTSTSDASPHHDAPAPCTCVGHCCAASTIAPISAVPAIHVPDAVAEVQHSLTRPSVDAPASPDLRLPFANGPPTA